MITVIGGATALQRFHLLKRSVESTVFVSLYLSKHDYHTKLKTERTEFLLVRKGVGFVGTGPNPESLSNHHVEHHRLVSVQLPLGNIAHNGTFLS